MGGKILIMINFELAASEVLRRTGKSISSFSPIVLTCNDLAGMALSTYVPGSVFFGQLEVTSNSNLLFSYESVSGTETGLSFNREVRLDVPKHYSSVIFDKISITDPSVDTLTEDTEMIFSGYKFTLI